MTLHCLNTCIDWKPPFFKVLSNNDTGAAPGKQAGFLVPKELRHFFPALPAAGSPLQPTFEKRVEAELFVEEKFLATVDARYQYQTWGGKRPAESRVTHQLGPMHKEAAGGDVLVMQASTAKPYFYRLTLVRRTSSDFPAISTLIAGRRWGDVFR
jgi:putative restriction endonuclease